MIPGKCSPNRISLVFQWRLSPEFPIRLGTILDNLPSFLNACETLIPRGPPRQRPPVQQGYRVLVMTLNGGKHVLIDASPAWNVAEFKDSIQDRTGIPQFQQRIIYRGEQLLDEYTLGDYRIENGAAIHLILKLRGD